MTLYFLIKEMGIPPSEAFSLPISMVNRMYNTHVYLKEKEKEYVSKGPKSGTKQIGFEELKLKFDQRAIQKRKEKFNHVRNK